MYVEKLNARDIKPRMNVTRPTAGENLRTDRTQPTIGGVASPRPPKLPERNSISDSLKSSTRQPGQSSQNGAIIMKAIDSYGFTKELKDFVKTFDTTADGRYAVNIENLVDFALKYNEQELIHQNTLTSLKSKCYDTTNSKRCDKAVDSNIAKERKKQASKNPSKTTTQIPRTLRRTQSCTYLKEEFPAQRQTPHKNGSSSSSNGCKKETFQLRRRKGTAEKANGFGKDFLTHQQLKPAPNATATKKYGNLSDKDASSINELARPSAAITREEKERKERIKKIRKELRKEAAKK